MKKTVFIDGKEFSYEQEMITYSNSSAISEEDGKLILQTTKRLFDKIGIKFYLAYGTLLGAIRDHNIIKGDEDVDVFITEEEKLFSHLPFLYANGLKVVRIQRGGMYSFRINERCYIDVYVLRPFRYSIWALYCYSLHLKATPKKYFKVYESIVFLGEECLCPARPEKLLEFWYGRNWSVPERGHKYFYEVPSHYYWIHYVRYPLRNLIKSMLGLNKSNR